MDKTELKHALKTQASTKENDIRRKIEVLISGDVFSRDIPNELEKLISKDMLSRSNLNKPEAPTGKDVDLQKAPVKTFSLNQSVLPSKDSPEEKAMPTSAKKQSLSQRLAALRGISLPGDYLHK